MRNLVLLSILGATALTAPVASAQDAQCIFNTHGQSAVAVEYTYTTKSDGTGRETGSGFIVSRSGYVLTNAHVVKPHVKDLEVVSSSITVRVGGLGSDPIPATVAPGDIDESTDLALIKIPRIASAPWAAVPIGEVDSLPVGSLLVGLGFPANGDLALVPAAPKTANTALLDGVEKAWWQTNLALSKGNSGGPIFGKLGTVVGIAVAINRNSNFLTYVIPIARAQPLLKKAGVNGVVSGPCADFPACRHPSHGIERYEVNEMIGDESEWRYGGGNPKANQPSWCSDLLGQLQAKYPQSSFTQGASREQEGFDNAVFRTGAKYKYYCEYRRLERPIYQEKKSVACLK